MRKTYAFLAALGVLLPGMSFANTTELRTEEPRKGEMPEINFNLKAFMPEKKKRPVTNHVDRIDNEEAIKALEGSWTFVMGDNYFEGSKGYVSHEFTAKVDGKTITFTSMTGEFHPMVAKYNTKSHSLYFQRKEVGQQNGLYVFQEPFIYDTATGTVKKRPVRAYYSEYERAVVFEDNLGISWVAYGDQTRKDRKGYYDVLDMSVCYQPMEGDWTDIGNALFTDGWLAPVLGVSPQDTQYEVPVQQNVADENLYRLVNPFKYGPLAAVNEAEGEGYIVFDVTDPDHVVFKLADAGFASSKARCSTFFVYNYMGSLVLINPFYTAAEVINEFGNDFPCSTYKDGIVSFDQTGKASDARFALQEQPNSPRFWLDDDSQQVRYSAGIILPSAASAAVGTLGAAEAEVEYFNLQGLPVANPEPGTIVIKRQGAAVTKEIIK